MPFNQFMSCKLDYIRNSLHRSNLIEHDLGVEDQHRLAHSLNFLSEEFIGTAPASELALNCLHMLCPSRSAVIEPGYRIADHVVDTLNAVNRIAGKDITIERITSDDNISWDFVNEKPEDFEFYTVEFSATINRQTENFAISLDDCEYPLRTVEKITEVLEDMDILPGVILSTFAMNLVAKEVGAASLFYLPKEFGAELQKGLL